MAARARRRPGRWIGPALGIALATAFACALVTQSVLTSDRSARAVLTALPDAQRVVRVATTEIVTPAVRSTAERLLASAGGGPRTEVVLLNPVRLGGHVVRLAAISPFERWVAGPSPGRCSASGCPLVALGAPPPAGRLGVAGARFTIARSARLDSAVPLNFDPEGAPGPPLLVTGDVTGLDGLAAISGLYRGHSWVTLLGSPGLHAWQLAATERRLQGVQASLSADDSAFSVTAPFVAIDRARAQASAATRRLLLAGGGALAAVVLFVVLAGGALRRDVADELTRLRAAGARETQCMAFAALEAAWCSGVAVLSGLALSLVASAVIAHGSGDSLAVLLHHGLLTAPALAGLAAGWLVAGAIVTALVLGPGERPSGIGLTDALALAGAGGLALALARGDNGAANDPLPVVLAPLTCLAAGVLVQRAGAPLLRAGERVARTGRPAARLAFIGLARAPSMPALAIAFIAVGVGLGGFGLAYRATLDRSSADQAADRVALDVTISPGPSFQTPLELAPRSLWSQLAGGDVEPVRRTEAGYLDGGATVTVPALGVPARALAGLHGVRDPSAPPSVLARRLAPPGPASIPAARLAPGLTTLSVTAASATSVSVLAELRNAGGAVEEIPLGSTSARTSMLRARLPAGATELVALELREPSGLAITNAHQNAESASPATRGSASVAIVSVQLRGRGLRPVGLGVAGWRGTGAASLRARAPGADVTLVLDGRAGVLRPPQPTDDQPLAVLADHATAAASSGGLLGLDVDGVALRARIAGVLSRFPSLEPGTSRFVVADEARLAGALDAAAPGQGRSDELWIRTRRPARLVAALATGPLSQLRLEDRRRIQSDLRSAPIARGVQGALLAGAALMLALAIVGMVVLLRAARDLRAEGDLAAQGAGPGTLRAELRLRAAIAAVLGVTSGLVITLVLTRLTVAAVRSGTTLAEPQPAIVAVVPVGALALWGLVALTGLVLAGTVTASRAGSA